jgi:hypothetical protein
VFLVCKHSANKDHFFSLGLYFEAIFIEQIIVHATNHCHSVLVH